jgi:hypothetical protein
VQGSQMTLQAVDVDQATSLLITYSPGPHVNEGSGRSFWSIGLQVREAMRTHCEKSFTQRPVAAGTAPSTLA